MEKLKNLWASLDSKLESLLFGKSLANIVAVSFGLGVLVSVVVIWIF